MLMAQYNCQVIIIIVVCLQLCTGQGGKDYLMRAHFGLPSVAAESLEGRPPIGVRFEIPYFTVSGVQVVIIGYSYTE